MFHFRFLLVQVTMLSFHHQMNFNLIPWSYLIRSKQLLKDIRNIPPEMLNYYLQRQCYSELRTQDGSLYAPASMICYRAALHQFFVEQTRDIIKEKTFFQSDLMLRTMRGFEIQKIWLETTNMML